MRYFNKLFLSLIIIFLSTAAKAHVIETWECKEARDPSWRVVVYADVLDKKDSGRIRVAGIVHNAYFRVQGFNRRWDFGESMDGTFDYAFLIKPTGEGTYYEFRDSVPGQSVEPTHILNCVPVPVPSHPH